MGCCICVSLVEKVIDSAVPETLEIVKDQPVKKEEMFKGEESSNVTRTHLLRFLGWLILYIGIYLTFSPLIAVVQWIPFIGYLLAHGISFIIGVFAFVISILMALLTVSLAWLYYRPLLALLMISSIGLAVGFIFFYH